MASERAHRVAAARPTLFDAVAYPDILISLVLANLTSPALWEFRTRIEVHLSADGERALADESGVESHTFVIEESQRYADHHLSHIAPLEVADQFGTVELSDVAERIGESRLSQTLTLIRDGVYARLNRGELQPNQNMLALMQAGEFPEYDYSIIELVRAHRDLLGRKKHKPWGVTNCADEAVLMASLACVFDRTPLSKCLIFGSPLHYAVLLEHSGQQILVNGKHNSLSQQRWQADFPSPEASLRELDRLIPFDRVVCAAGYLDLSEQRLEMDDADLAAVGAAFEQFLGTRLPPLNSAAVAHDAPSAHPPDWAWRRLDECRSASDARAELRLLANQFPGSSLELARYTARDVDVADPSVYLDAALRGPRLQTAAATVSSFAQAVETVRRVEGGSSVLRSRERIALPDEVLLFNTADDVDRALLLLALLTAARRRASGTSFAEERLELRVTGSRSCVGIGADWLDLESLRMGTEPTDGLILRIVG